MPVDVLQQKKEEVAQSMLNDFKNELNFFQSTVISFFEKKITQTIISQSDLGNSLEDAKPRMNFIERMLIKLSPSAAERVFLFIKEKQEKLVKATTVEELDNLKKGIVVPPEVTQTNQPEQNVQQANPEGDQTSVSSPQTEQEQEDKGKDTQPDTKGENIAIGVGSGAGLGLTAKAIGQVEKLQTANKLEKTASIEDPKAFAKKFEELAQGLKKEKINPKLTMHQQKMIDKSIKEFQKVAKEVDGDTLSAVKMLQKLDKKLPNSLLKSIDPVEAAKLADLITNDGNFVIGLATEEVGDLQKILKAKGINNISDDVVRALKLMKGTEELQGAVHILTKLKGIRAITRGLRGVALLDIIFTGIDIWALCEGLDAAEFDAKVNELRSSTAREHQRVQFGSALAMTAISIIISCSAIGSAGGPVGTAIGAVLGVLGFAASQAIDVYYNAVEFYLQNTQDFQKQYRTELKQAIIQSAASEEWNLNVTSRLYASAKKAGASRAEYYLNPFGAYMTDKAKLTTTEDARKSLIRQEEYEKSQYPLIQEGAASGKLEADFIKTLSADQQAEFKQQQKALNAVIDKRMEYIKRFMYEKKGTPEYTAFVTAMKNSMGIKAIEKILVDSNTYYKMGQTGADQYVAGAKTIVEYKKQFGEKLKTESPQGFAALEKMWLAQPYMVAELYQGIVNTESMFRSSWESPEYDKKDKIDIMKKNLDLIKRYYEYKSLDTPLEEQRKLDISIRALDARMIESLLISGDFACIGALSRNADQVKNYFTQDWSQDRWDTQVESSESVGQNIIYRIAREIHGYTGHNTMPELIDFFRSDKDAALGLYYDNGWKINNDRAIDKSIAIKDMEKMTTEEIMKMRVSPARRNEIFSVAIDPIVIAKLTTVPVGGRWLPGSSFYLTDDAQQLDTKADAGDMDHKMNMEYRIRMRKIVTEEKSYTTPAVQKMVEQAIIAYVQKYSQPVAALDAEGNPDLTKPQEQGYIEMPYYLIMAAKKAKIGNIERFLFKYENNQIVACTSRLYLNEPLQFTQTKTKMVKQYVSLGEQVDYKSTVAYISYVDQAKEKFEKLITFDENELDLPEEYIKKYQTKIKERNNFKANLANMTPDVAIAKLQAEYQNYYNRFDTMYTAMLLQISKFSWENDLDSAAYLQTVEAYAGQINAISIQGGIVTGAMTALSDNQKKFFNATIQTRKPRDKSITDLAQSSDPEDQSKAIRAVKQILKSLMEAQVMSFDAQGNISSIVHGESKGFEYKLLDQEPQRLKGLQKMVNERLRINGDVKKYFIPTTLETPSIDESKSEIKTLNAEQEQTTNKTSEVQKIIESTQPDLIYPGRGSVTFDPETNMLRSRDKSTKIDSKQLKIEGLPAIKFATLTELVMFANLINRFRSKYPGTKDFYFGSRLGLGVDYGIFKPETGADTQIIDLDTLKKRYPSILTIDNDVRDEVINYINAGK